MFCMECGTEVAADAKFCGKCGHANDANSLTNNSAFDAPKSPIPQMHFGQVQVNRAQGPSGGLKSSISLIAFLLLGLLVVYVYRSSQPDSSTPTATRSASQPSRAEDKNGSINTNSQQAQVIARMRDVESYIPSASPNTREGETERNAWEKRRADMRAEVIGKHVEDWFCLFRDLPKIISEDVYVWDDKKVASMDCVWKEDSGTNKIHDKWYFTSMHFYRFFIVLDEMEARKLGKLYEKDRIIFSGTLTAFSNMRLDFRNVKVKTVMKQ